MNLNWHEEKYVHGIVAKHEEFTLNVTGKGYAVMGNNKYVSGFCNGIEDGKKIATHYLKMEQSS